MPASDRNTGGEDSAGRFYIETWGCQMNVHDSEKLAGSLRAHGYEPVRDPGAADVILLNTCSIREKAQEKVFDELGRLKPLKEARPGLVLGVCGCVAQQEGSAIFARAPHVDLVLGTRATGSLPVLVNRLRAGDLSARHACDVELRDDSIHHPYDRIDRSEGTAAKAYVTVIEGCNHRCSFCIVPTTRGREVCRDMDDVLAEVRDLAARGTLEIEFLGQTVNAYRDGRGRGLGDLLLAAAEIEGVARLRFTTSHPAQMTDALVAAMAAARPKLCPYLHLPAQSGSSRVLREMRRGYDREGYRRRIDAIRERIPEMSFGTDIIVGFPGETPAEFEETLSLLREVEFDTVYSFTYSPRPGTRAGKGEDSVPGREKLRRLSRLHALQNEIQERRMRRFVGRDVPVLVEGSDKRGTGLWSGRTPEARVALFGGNSAPGRIERVVVEASTAFSLRGRLFDPSFA